MRKGAIVSSSPQGMTCSSSSIKIWCLQAYRMQNKCHGVKQNAKICAIDEQNVMKIEVFIVGGQRIEKEGMVKREKRED